MNNNELRKQCSQYLEQLNEEALQYVRDYLDCLCKMERHRLDTPPERLAELKQLREAAQLQEEQERDKQKAELQADREEAKAAFNAWVKRYKASFELTDIPDRYCTGSEDHKVMINYIVSQLGYTPSSNVINALLDTQTAPFIYGFRRGSNYVNNQQKKKATKGGNL